MGKKMHKLLLIFAALMTTFLAAPANAEEAQNNTVETRVTELRHFLFVGHIGPKGWQNMLENPSDREAAGRDAIEKLGGKLIAYYFGLGENKNYIIVALPDAKTAKAIQVLRMSSGMLIDYTFIELMSSKDMLGVLHSMKSIRAVDDLQKDD